MRAQAKKFFFYTSAVKTNSFHMAGHIKDDIDLIRIWITIDHASETLRYGPEVMDFNCNTYRFEQTPLNVRFAGLDHE